jgi:hypothetical protein
MTEPLFSGPPRYREIASRGLVKEKEVFEVND